ncbi:hypothetical protein Calkr_1536 [Caldicellulosiruptor acetigenus I77R1B]|uniref:Uncharacterized protein n=1 Tax=Caldicellulosiruptor acetigenus (strain ATCC 700853 / DSM 12137 / I77R1B) TaxID=632335 RepID=E4S9G0_CALA7|nr:hypothetical protein Calkr_1536 [Caldicellulosiruptor acetigenus I77R1B]
MFVTILIDFTKYIPDFQAENLKCICDYKDFKIQPHREAKI